MTAPDKPRSRLRFPIPLSILLFLALTAVGAYYVRKGMLERTMANAIEIDDEETIRAMLNSWPCPVNAGGEIKLPAFLRDRFPHDIQGKTTPLCWAALRGKPDIALTCVRKGANVNAKGPTGSTALHFAAAGGHRELVRALLDRGANPNAAGPLGETPLHRAAWVDDNALVVALLDAGADPNARDISGNTPLHFAQSVAVAVPLVAHGGRVMEMDAGGRTPLHWAASNAHGVVAMWTSWEERSAEEFLYGWPDIGRPRGTPELIDFLVSKGASVNWPDKEARTPLRAAKDRKGWTMSSSSRDLNRFAAWDRLIETLVKHGAKE